MRNGENENPVCFFLFTTGTLQERKENPTISQYMTGLGAGLGRGFVWWAE